MVDKAATCAGDKPFIAAVLSPDIALDEIEAISSVVKVWMPFFIERCHLTGV